MIALEHIAKQFGDTRVLDDVSLTLDTGRSLAVLGRSGTGKSVLLRVLLGLTRPDTGRILVDGQEMTRAGRRAFFDQAGVLFQGGALFDGLRIWENVAFRLRHGAQRLPRADARARAIDTLERVGLEARVADLYPADLSGGMQKRAALARAIVARPKYLFFDEPTSGLDPVTARDIDRLIRSLVDDLGATALTITHDMPSLRLIADDVALLEAGRIAWFGEAATMQQATVPLVQEFLAP